MENLDTQGGATLDPGSWLAGFMRGTTRHCSLLNIEAVGLKVLEWRFLKLFCSIIQSTETLDLHGGVGLDLRSLIGRIYVEDH